MYPKENETFYYLVYEKFVAKMTNQNGRVQAFRFKDGAWEEVALTFITDKLNGYDPLDDTPFGFGGGSVWDIDDLTEEEAMKLMAEQTIELLKEKWKQDFAEKKAEWDRDPGWPAKLVKTKFTLYGKQYALESEDLGHEGDCWDQGFMESVQHLMKKDLESYGATDIYNLGFLD